MRLVRIARDAGGRYALTFERRAATVEITADIVVLALPFAVLRELDYAGAGFDALKDRAIQELGRGHNAKLQLQFAAPSVERARSLAGREQRLHVRRHRVSGQLGREPRPGTARAGS